MAPCEANQAMCIWWNLKTNSTLRHLYDELREELRVVKTYAQHYNDLRPHHSNKLHRRYYYDESSSGVSASVYVPIIVVLLIVKLIFWIWVINRCMKRRRRMELLERQLAQQQGNSLLAPPPYEPPPPILDTSRPGRCQGLHIAGGTCMKCGVIGDNQINPRAAKTARVVEAKLHTPEAAARTSESRRPSYENADTAHLKVADSPRSRRASEDKPRCKNFHIPWKKCPTCTVDPPRPDHVELDTRSPPPGPHEMHAHVPPWQGQPRERTTNYGGFYDTASTPPPRRADPQQTTDGILARSNDAASLMTPPTTTTAPVSPPLQTTRTVANGHQSFATYQAASGQPFTPFYHVPIRSVSPVGDERLRVSSEGMVDLEDGRGQKKKKGGDGLITRYLGS